jgi:hypothetical protein
MPSNVDGKAALECRRECEQSRPSGCKAWWESQQAFTLCAAQSRTKAVGLSSRFFERKKRSVLSIGPPKNGDISYAIWSRGIDVGMRTISEDANLVASFATAFVPGVVDAVCIKYAMYDGAFRLSYWSAKWPRALYQCIEYYSGFHYHGSDLQRVSDDPEFCARLPIHHPVRTMTSRKPDLTQLEYLMSKQDFSVSSFRFVDQDDSGRIECMFADGNRRVEVLPGYIVMNLCGFLKASRDLSADMTPDVDRPA